MRSLHVFALLLALAACDTGPVDLIDLRIDGLSQDSAELAGTWDLHSVTTSGFGGPPTTIPSDDLDWTETYTFRADGTATRIYDGDPEETKWEIVTYLFEYEEGRFTEARRLQIGERQRESFGIDGDRLYFDDRPSDGALSEYARR